MPCVPCDTPGCCWCPCWVLGSHPGGPSVLSSVPSQPRSDTGIGSPLSPGHVAALGTVCARGGQEVALGLRVSPGGAEGAAQPHQQLRGRRCVTLGGSSPHPKPPDGFGVTNKGGDGSVQPSDPTQDHPAPPTAELSPRVPPVPPQPKVLLPLCPPKPQQDPQGSAQAGDTALGVPVPSAWPSPAHGLAPS